MKKVKLGDIAVLKTGPFGTQFSAKEYVESGIPVINVKNIGYGDINEIQTSRKMRHLYVCGDQHTDVGEGIGLMAPRVAACAAHEANKVIQLIMEA